MTRNGTREVSLDQTSVDMTPRVWSEDEIRNAQLNVAAIVLEQETDNPEAALREALDMLGLLPSDKIRKGRYRTNMTTEARRRVAEVMQSDVTTTDMERHTSRVVDTQGHGTLKGYNMHIKRYERPCEDCQIMYELEREATLAEKGFTLSPNHTIGYQ